MRLSTYKYHVRIAKNGKSALTNYEGYKTKREAEDVARQWNDLGYETKVEDERRER